MLPSAMRRGGTLVRVPDLIGMDATDATGLLREVGLRLGIFRFQWSQDYGTGIVIGLEPPTGTRVERRSRVDLTISTGRFR